jgi:hypothetical protein
MCTKNSRRRTARGCVHNIRVGSPIAWTSNLLNQLLASYVSTNPNAVALACISSTGEVSLKGNFCLEKCRCAGVVGAGAATTQLQSNGRAVTKDRIDMMAAACRKVQIAAQTVDRIKSECPSCEPLYHHLKREMKVEHGYHARCQPT